MLAALRARVCNIFHLDRSLVPSPNSEARVELARSQCAVPPLLLRALKTTGVFAMKLRSCVSTSLLFAVFILASMSQRASADATQVILTFYTLTAAHAALGAPMQYQITLTNTGTTSVTLTDEV